MTTTAPGPGPGPGGTGRAPRPAHALVVGASSTLGRAVAVGLARDGFVPHLWGRDLTRLEGTARACADAGDDPPVVDLVDVTSPVDLRRAADRFRGAGPTRAVVWAAGQFDWAATQDADAATWRRVLDVTLVAAAELTALLAPALVAHAPSSLVYVGSTAAHRTFAHNAAYVTAKHGLAALAEATWLDLRSRHVGVTLVSPGPVAAGATLDSPFAETSDLLVTPADVAAAVGYVVGLATAPGGRACPTLLRLEPYLDD